MQRESDRLARVDARSQYTLKEIKLQRESDRLSKAKVRLQYLPKEIEMQRESDRLAKAKKRVRSEKACEQMSDNQVSDPSFTLHLLAFC